MLSSLSGSVTVYEVSPRDGLQNETNILSLSAKRELIEALVQAGLRHIEVTSFVSPRWVPQLADAVELVQSLAPAPGVSFSALCPNATGLERAKLAGLKEVAIFLSASESHNQRNTNKSIQRSLEVFEELIPAARDAGLRVRAYISTVWGCPYEGEVDPQRALQIARDLVRWGAYQISLGDTIGVGTPLQTQGICQLFLAEFAQEQLALHFHDTRGTALSNVLVGLDAGIRTFDAAVAGLGGCPYAPGASGNLATEDLVYLLHGMGLETGIDLPALIQAGEIAERVVGRKLPGKVHQAGLPRKR
jgi:hydroxymethylglutaryl-CoA lyase